MNHKKNILTPEPKITIITMVMSAMNHRLPGLLEVTAGGGEGNRSGRLRVIDAACVVVFLFAGGDSLAGVPLALALVSSAWVGVVGVSCSSLVDAETCRDAACAV